MARAKQTNRADARRRYRQTLAQESSETEDVEAAGQVPANDRGATPGRRSSAPTRPAPSPARPGITSAFRGAYRPAHYREDIAALPQLLRGRWFLIALALVVVGFVGALASPNAITLFLFQTLTLPPAMIPIFLVGFTAPRASYLLGFLIGFIDIVLYSIYIVGVAAPASGQTIPLGEYLSSGFLVGLPASVLFSAGAAWYRRFLALSNAGRPQQRGGNRSRNGAKAAARR